MSVPQTLVLGGGGVTAIAWQTGWLLGALEAGFDATRADRLIGTSAGAVVAAQISAGPRLAALFAAQVDPALQVPEVAPPVHAWALLRGLLPTLRHWRQPQRWRQAVGAFAQQADTPTPADRRALVAQRLPSANWPAPQALQITAVDAGSGALRVFDAASGVSLLDAVSASCAVPGLWPTASIDGRAYMDGGLRSSDNADLAAGSTTVLVLSPMGGHRLAMPGGRLADQLHTLRDAGSRAALVTPDDATRQAIGRRPMDPARRAPAAQAGRAQGQREAQRVMAAVMATVMAT